MFFQIEWNSVPNHVVCAFPYILSITQESVEFRYAVNGSLLQTLCMPELKLITSKVNWFVSICLYFLLQYFYSYPHGLCLSLHPIYHWLSFVTLSMAHSSKHFSCQNLRSSLQRWIDLFQCFDLFLFCHFSCQPRCVPFPTSYQSLKCQSSFITTQSNHFKG
jgi:hypothetical protein